MSLTRGRIMSFPLAVQPFPLGEPPLLRLTPITLSRSSSTPFSTMTCSFTGEATHPWGQCVLTAYEVSRLACRDGGTSWKQDWTGLGGRKSWTGTRLETLPPAVQPFEPLGAPPFECIVLVVVVVDCSCLIELNCIDLDWIELDWIGC